MEAQKNQEARILSLIIGTPKKAPLLLGNPHIDGGLENARIRGSSFAICGGASPQNPNHNH